MAALVMDGNSTPADDGDRDHTASHVLRSLAARNEPSISFGTILAAAGARVHGLALLLIVLPETLPLPLPSASTVLAIPLFLISLHLAVFGEGGGWSSPRLDAIRIRRTALAAAVRYVAPVLEWLEALSRPRWSAIARRERLIGLVCLYLSAVLFLPLPFVNAPPAICMALLALGLIQRDGVIVTLGLAGSAAVTVALAWIVLLAGGLVGGTG